MLLVFSCFNLNNGNVNPPSYPFSFSSIMYNFWIVRGKGSFLRKLSTITIISNFFQSVGLHTKEEEK